MRAALFFHPEGYSTRSPKLMGRNAAGESFLKGFLAHSRAADFSALVDEPAHGEAFRAAVAAAGRAEPVSVFDRGRTGQLARVGTLFHPGPDIVSHACRRSLFQETAWSLCGITHTTSSAGAMDAITAMVAGPVQPWDALICTSSAVKANVEHLLAGETERLWQRLGTTRTVVPRLPVIPLGIDTGAFAFSALERDAARAAFGVSDAALVVLFMGRLSFHAKAHPLAMYQALEAAARTSGRPVVLVECGWFANAWIADAFTEGAAAACPNVRVVRRDGRKADERRAAWAAADVFCSLSDNIQETFGLTPVEAMAAGLPVVVSDWDGYRDTVRDGIDGFRIPTLMPAPGLGQDLAARHALGLDSYDVYCGLTSAVVAVDVEAAAQAFHTLFTAPELRRRMGEAGRARARDIYDWSAIIPRYESLWRELEEVRNAHRAIAPAAPCSWPARPDPFTAFAAYPTHALRADTVLELAEVDAAHAQARARAALGLKMVNFADMVRPTADELQTILAAAAEGPAPAATLVAGIAPDRHAHALRLLAWLAKLGLLRMTRRHDKVTERAIIS
ncbi:glycosyltransferase family 4 protein [Xanthobacter agilis]|uniref:glycosyltransferase family 4 protein n=1 Tax=Xanthobacter agilis TaxID=47492 RepID=UPI00372B33C4